jgi:hypothetical protein
MAWRVGSWGRVECPVRPEEQAWIEESLDWMVATLGRARLLGDVVLPTDDYFPGTYEGSREDVRRVFERICRHMGVDSGRIDLEHDDDPEEARDLSGEVPIHWEISGAAGHYRERNGRPVVTIRDDQARRPTALVATVAHELGHVLLLGDGRIDPERKDHEPLTDLLTIYFGLGVFSANAAFEYATEPRGRYSYSQTSRLGYLTEPMYGYGLARYAWLRDEPDPPWARYVDANPRAFLKRGLRYLAR